MGAKLRLGFVAVCSLIVTVCLLACGVLVAHRAVEAQAAALPALLQLQQAEHRTESPTAAARQLQQAAPLDPGGLFELNAPPTKICSPGDLLLCIWYPVTVKWYYLLNSVPRFIIYDYQLGQGFDKNNIGLQRTVNYLVWTQPWVYVQSLVLMTVPSLLLLILALVALVVFQLACFATCCCRCFCFHALVPGEAVFPPPLQVAVKLLLLGVAIGLVFGFLHEVTGFSLQRQAVQSLILIVRDEVVLLQDTTRKLASDIAVLNSNFTVGPAPGEVQDLASLFDVVIEPLDKAYVMSSCVADIPAEVEGVALDLDLRAYYAAAEAFLRRTYGCPDFGMLALFSLAHVPLFFQIFLAVLAVLLLHPFPPLLFSNLSVLAVVFSLLVAAGSLMNATFLSDTCAQLTLLEEDKGTDPLLNTINPPHFIISCELQNKYLDPVFSFADDSITFAQNKLAELRAIVDDDSRSETARAWAEDQITVADVTVAALKNMLDLISNYFSCDHFKELYFALKDLLCQIVLNSAAASFAGCLLVSLSLIVGFFAGLLGFVVLRVPRSQPVAERAVDRGDVVSNSLRGGGAMLQEDEKVTVTVNRLQGLQSLQEPPTSARSSPSSKSQQPETLAVASS